MPLFNLKKLGGSIKSVKPETATLAAEERAFRATDQDLMDEQRLFRSESDVVKEKESVEEAAAQAPSACPYHFVPLKMGGNGRTHKPSSGAASLIEEIGGLPPLVQMTGAFYEKAFRDATLDKFIRSHDDPHAERFARWIHQKLTNSTLWDEDRAARSKEPVEVAYGQLSVVHDRSSAHAAAWYSPKRPNNEVGRHFKLDECRVWMRLHFWAMRETIGDTSPAFADYYVRFIGHFINVYEGTAPAFARESYRWSESQSNIDEYVNNGYQMKSVLGLSHGQALKQLPEHERNDDKWPYMKN